MYSSSPQRPNLLDLNLPLAFRPEIVAKILKRDLVIGGGGTDPDPVGLIWPRVAFDGSSGFEGNQQPTRTLPNGNQDASVVETRGLSKGTLEQ